MIENLSEEEMRHALFGTAAQHSKGAEIQVSGGTASTPVRRPKGLSSRLRVILHVTKVYEGPQEVFIYDANTLSTLVAESEAKAAAKKQRFKYFDVISVKPAQV